MSDDVLRESLADISKDIKRHNWKGIRKVTLELNE